ncbi:MAG: hypothetical protein OJF61_001924 [Rhodanobacteraceae bacterium]|nr:MAG: hypothetical protein OJF61_001924 [Rhodanobacteraceae bacterium]
MCGKRHSSGTSPCMRAALAPFAGEEVAVQRRGMVCGTRVTRTIPHYARVRFAPPLRKRRGRIFMR